MNGKPIRALRCAIYTRKSTDEGLDQHFNSLHAQREACEAYIRAQRAEGWTAVRTRYDDGGFSGGAMDRPALRRLLSDASAGRIDVVVVYKVDRLTRSLADFGRIIETFDGRGISFVSVTQGFNTTSSTGRLTLNVLLSFAQFERDVTGERIRDKIAASKAKGMWLGGRLPLGYGLPIDASRALVVDEGEARKVKLIFNRYLAVQNLSALQHALWAEGVGPRADPKRCRSSRLRKFSTGALRYLLSNRVYVGEIVHKDQTHAGRHPALIDRPTFDAAQEVLKANSDRRTNHVGYANRTLLRWLIYDRDGQLMAPLFAVRGSKRYHYYAAGPLIRGEAGDDAIRRVRGAAADELVTDLIARLLGGSDPPTPAVVRSLVRRVEVHSSTVHVVVDLRAFAAEIAVSRPVSVLRSRLSPTEQCVGDPNFADRVCVVLPVRLVVWGGRRRITPPLASAGGERPEGRRSRLFAKLKRAHAELADCGLDPDGSLNQLYRAQAPRSGARSVWLAFLAPDLQRAIAAGEELPGAEALERGDVPMPASWDAQRQLLSRASQVAGSGVGQPNS